MIENEMVENIRFWKTDIEGHGSLKVLEFGGIWPGKGLEFDV